MMVERKPHPPAKKRRPKVVRLQLGGQMVHVYEVENEVQTMFVSSDLFEAILQETGHYGKAKEAR